MTQAQETKIFKESIVPVMDRLGKVHSDKDMYFVAVVSELRKKNVPLDNNIVNMMLDKMAHDSMPKGSWDYISGKVLDGNLVKTFFDWTHPSASDSPLETEIKRRAELMYNASGTEKVIASVATAGTDICATAPVAVLCPQSAVYGFLVQGGYDVVNEKVLLPESKQERDVAAKSSIATYNALEEKTNWNIIPGWMYSTQGVTDIKTASEKKLTSARDWAKRNADWWHGEYEKLGREHKEEANVNGKNFTRQECLVKYNQYDKFRGVCQKELTQRYLEEQKAKEQQRQEALSNAASESEEDESEYNTTENNDTSEKTDYWGQLLNALGFNGLGNVGKHLGLTLATLPDMILGVFTGKTKSLGMNSDTLIPLASLAAGHFIKNPVLKAALMGYGGLNLLNKVGNEAISQRTGQNVQIQNKDNTNVRYKQYADEVLNPRIANLHIEGNQLLADIDKVPCTITLPDTTVKAYQTGALPLNTLANAVLAKSDLMSQQAEQASLAYNNLQQTEKTRGIR